MKRFIRSRVLAFAMTGTLAAMPVLAAEGVMAEPTFSWSKALDYTVCAAGVALAATGAGLTMALLGCGKIVIVYWE